MRILDPTCSVRSIWFDKNNPHVVHCDKRVEEIDLSGNNWERHFSIKPHVQMDYTAMSFPDGCFDMVVFDPPHLKDLTSTAWMAQKYGRLFPGWEDNIQAGFDESWRVLREDGILIFKWSVGDNENRYVPLNKVLELAPPPLFGHTTGKRDQTRWITFIKFKEVFDG